MNESSDNPKVTEMRDLRDPVVSRLYADTPRDEPGAAIDERILSAAREHVGSRSQRARSSWLPLAGGIAASVVAVLVVIELRGPGDEMPGIAASSTTESVALRANPAEMEIEAKGETGAPPARAAAPVADLMQAAEPVSNDVGPQGRLAARREQDEAVRDKRTADKATANVTQYASAPQPAATTPDELMMEIERHWRGGNQERAAKLFELLKTRFPNFEFENAESGWFEQLQATLDADAP